MLLTTAHTALFKRVAVPSTRCGSVDRIAAVMAGAVQADQAAHRNCWTRLVMFPTMCHCSRPIVAACASYQLHA